MIAAVVAADENWGIGSNNELLAHIPDDLKNFKRLTENNVIIMGRKTYESLPNKPLPNRTNIVISSKNHMLEDKGTLFVSMDFIKMFLETQSNDALSDCFVIGGGMIYKELLPYCEKVYVTKIHKSFNNVDTYFPNIDNMPEWEMTMVSEIRKYNDIEYQFCIYRRNGDNNEQ